MWKNITPDSYTSVRGACVVCARRSILDKVVHGADLITAPLPRVPLVELSGVNRLLIENHMGVIAYDISKICVRVTYGQVDVMGENLKLTYMTKEQLVITGCIDGLRVCRR